jgi:hypothetical protein
MLESVEVRWFFQGQMPDKLLPILDDSNIQSKWACRSDYYLLIGNCDNVGIKLRNSRLELKWLKKSSNLDLPQLNIYGKIEHWIRWEWNDKKPFNDILQFIHLNKGNTWIKIDKNRLQQKFNIHDNSLVEVSSESIHFDFAIEITRLNAFDQPWWSIAFDSYLKENHEYFFTLLSQRYVNDDLRTLLKTESSYGYPKWISKNSKLEWISKKLD